MLEARDSEDAMRDPIQTPHVISPFGEGYIAEVRGDAPHPLHNSSSGAAKWMAVVMAVLVFGITTATAITMSRTPASDFSWSQSANFIKVPFAGGIEEALY
jgi:hypothetical protein